MKVLFLDIDGVLNNSTTTERCNQYTGADSTLCKRLTNWLRTTDVKIVLSSTWRRAPEMWSHLNDRGIDWIDITPVYPNVIRGMEIMAWLDDHPEVTHYAILDDSRDMLSSQYPRCVFTDDRYGLQDEHIYLLQKLFQ